MSGTYRTKQRLLRAAFFAAYLGALAWVLLTDFHQAVYLSISSDTYTTDYTLTTTTGDGESVIYTQQPPAGYPFFGVFTEHYDFSLEPSREYFTVYFGLDPARPPRQLEIALNTAAAPLVVHEICLHNHEREQCLRGAAITALFSLDQAYIVGEDRLEVAAQRLVLRAHTQFAALSGTFAAPNRARQFLALLAVGGAFPVLGLLYTRRARLRAYFFSTKGPVAANVFLLFGLVFGTALALVNPLFEVPDELIHLIRTFQLAESLQNRPCMQVALNGKLTAFELHYQQWAGNTVADDSLAYFKHLPPRPRYALQAPRLPMARYSAVPYLPAAIGIAVGGMLELSWLNIFYLARLTTVWTWLILVYLAVRVLPLGKWLLCLLALSPMALYQAASLSADSLTIALGLLTVALALKLSCQPSRVYGLVTLVSATLLALCKLPYLLLAATSVAALTQSPASPKRHALLASALALAVFVIGGVLWAVVLAGSTEIFVHMAGRQLHAIAAHPLNYLALVINTLELQGWELLKQFVGNFGWLENPLPEWFVLVHLSVLGVYALTDSDYPVTLTPSSKLVLLGVTALGVLAVVTALYFIETPELTGDIIDGLQGRYFIPLALPFLLALGNRRCALPGHVHALTSLVYLPLSLGLTLLTLHTYYL